MVLKLNILIITVEIKSCYLANSSHRPILTKASLNVKFGNTQTIDVAIKMLDSFRLQALLANTK